MSTKGYKRAKFKQGQTVLYGGSLYTVDRARPLSYNRISLVDDIGTRLRAVQTQVRAVTPREASVVRAYDRLLVR